MRLAIVLTLALAAIPLTAHEAAGGTEKAAQTGHAAAKAARATRPSLGPIVLQSQVMVEDRVVVLRDLFTNLPAEKAEIPVAYAPDPGRRAVFDARWLYRVARAHGVSWRPMIRKRVVLSGRSSMLRCTGSRL